MSTETKSVKYNMMMNTLLRASSIVFPLITLPYVTRILGTEGVGRVYFASAVIAFFAVFAELGIPLYGIRACARVREDRNELSRTAQEIIVINLISCAAVYLVFFVLLLLLPRFRDDRWMMVIMSTTMVLNAIGAEWLYKALEQYAYITIRTVALKLVTLILMFMTVKSENDYMIYGCLTVFTAAASNIINVLNLNKCIDIKPAGHYCLRKHLPQMIMLFALTAAVMVYTSMDTAMVGFIKGDAEAGLYGVSVRVKLLMVSLVTAVSEVLLPRTSFYLAKGRRTEAENLLSRTIKLTVTVSVPVILLFELFAGISISVIAGEGFEGAVIPMRIIMPSVLIIGISNLIGMQMLIPAGREKDVVVSAIIGAAADFLLNILLIPRFASAGAAAATLTAEIFVLIYLMRCIGKDGLRVLFDIRKAYGDTENR